MRWTWMGALCLVLAGCDCGGGGGGDGGQDGGEDGGDGGSSAFSISALNATQMRLQADYTPQISAALGPNDRIGVAYFKEDAGSTVILPDGGYYTPDGGSDVSYSIEYLEWQGGQVVTGPETVQVVHNISGVSVAFQGNGQPAVAYLGGPRDDNISVSWRNHDAVLSYRSAGGTWTEQIAVMNSGQAAAGNPVSDMGPILGLFPGLVFDGNTAYLVYRDVHYGQSLLGDYGGSDFELASGGPSSWNHQVLVAGGNDKLAWGGHPHLIMANGQPAVVFDRVPNAPATAGIDVFFQRRARDGGTAWSTPPIRVEEAGDTTSGPSVAWESGEHFGVAWADRLAQGGQALYFSETLDGRTFPPQGDPIVQSGSGGWYPSVAFAPDESHDPVVAYYVCAFRGGVAQLNTCPTAEDELQISRRIGGYWYPATVDPEGGLQPKLFFLSTGKMALVYRDPRRGTIKLAVER